VNEIKVELADSEWMSLIDGERPGGLSKCCPNISNLRDQIILLARDGGVFNLFTIEEFRRALGWVADGHDINGIPALMKLVDQLRLGSTPHEPTTRPESL
jgi:hypothetical protein